MLGLFALIWLFSVGGVILDKFVYTFPWMGLETHIGGIRVDVSRGWDIDSGFDKRAAGFSRSSISAAMLLPTLALVIAPRVRSWLIRRSAPGGHGSAVALTTQKGALVAIAVVGDDPVRSGMEPLQLALHRLPGFRHHRCRPAAGHWRPVGGGQRWRIQFHLV